MIALLMGAGLALLFAFLGTPLFIRFLVRKSYGQFIRDDGPTTHHTKRGTPTMGGTVVVLAVLASYGITHLVMWMINPASPGPSASALLLLFLMVGMGLVGFLDDFIKISKQRSLGLNAKAKLILQAAVGIIFAILALYFPDENGVTPASYQISLVRDIPWLNLAFAGTLLGTILFVLWSNLIITAATNGVNLTDGLDGLAAGASIMVFGAYTLMGIWQSNQSCGSPRQAGSGCYIVRDPLDLALLAAILSAALGRLPVVEHLTGEDLHGRHRVTGHRRRRRGLRDPVPDRTAARLHRRPLRPHHPLGDHPGRLLQAHQGQTVLQDGPAPAPL